MTFPYEDIIHDLKSPLSAIKGFADAMLDGTIEKKDYDKYLKIISKQSSEMTDMINTALALCKMESVSVRSEKINVSAMILNQLCLFEREISAKNIDVSFENPCDVFFMADSTLLERVFSNLISNAVKYCNHGGFIRLSILQNEENLLFSVKNSGEGIPADKMPFIFERFTRADNNVSGNGIGLASAKQIAEFYSGSITAVSIENEFTEFKLSLPYKR